MQWNNVPPFHPDPLSPLLKTRLAFPRKRQILPALLTLLAVLLAAPAIASDEPAAPREKRSDEAGEVGLWVWQHQSVRDAEVREELIAFCTRQGINRILIQVRFEGEPGERRFADADAFRDLLERAAKAGIAIEALDGSHAMGLESDRADTLQRLDAVLAFQKELPPNARFAGVHYDIEPYLNPRWRSGDEKGVARETLETMALIRARVTPETGLTLAYDIPSWYDTRGESLDVEFQGETKNFHQHIQDLSDYIGVMSYRRAATGPNSILAISEGELAYGAKIGKKVYPAMETKALKGEEASITFHGMGPEAFLKALREVRKTGAQNPAYGGVLIHHYGSLKELLSDSTDRKE